MNYERLGERNAFVAFPMFINSHRTYFEKCETRGILLKIMTGNALLSLLLKKLLSLL